MAFITGIVLAAGAGSRMGRPKALMRTAEGEPWLVLASRTLRDAGCSNIVVVLGASAEAASFLVAYGDQVVVAADWADGMSASLRAGLEVAAGDAVLLSLVDLPGLPVAVGERMLDAEVHPDVLRQAVYNGRPGHPVLIGRGHWEPLAFTLTGDKGARAYLAANGVDEVECGDLFDGKDVDELPQ